MMSSTSRGEFLSGCFTVMLAGLCCACSSSSAPTPTAPPTTITVSYDGKLTDRLGWGTVTPDGTPDSVFTATLAADSGNRKVTRVELSSDRGGIWDTKSTKTKGWFIGAASATDAPLQNNEVGEASFEMKGGGNVKLFAAGDKTPKADADSFTLTLYFADGTSASATAIVPASNETPSPKASASPANGTKASPKPSVSPSSGAKPKP